jgi:hypothetical protein
MRPIGTIVDSPDDRVGLQLLHARDTCGAHRARPRRILDFCVLANIGLT